MLLNNVYLCSPWMASNNGPGPNVARINIVAVTNNKTDTDDVASGEKIARA